MIDPTRPVVLTDLTIWNGGEKADADTLVLEGAQITAVCAADDVRHQLQGRTVVDSNRFSFPGAIAMPGLIDAHVHMVLNPEDKIPPGPDFLPPLEPMRERAAAMVRAGITTARDLGGGAWRELELRDEIAGGDVIGPRLICSGQPVTCPQGHCHFWGGEADGVEAAGAVIRRQIEHGVDLIKVMATGGRITKGTDPLKSQFDTATLTGIVDIARNAGFPVAAHCHGTAGIEAAALAGVSTIEHCSWVGEGGWASDFQEAVAGIILDKGIWVSPTINRGWQRMLDSDGPVLGRVRSAFRTMMDQGIEFMASTDAGIPGVFHHHLPEALGVFAGITQSSPQRILRSATSDAARGLGLEGIGRLAPGYSADVLIVDGDPLTDLASLTRPVSVWARGRMMLLSA